MARTRKPSGQTLSLFAVLLESPGQWRHGYEISKDTGLKSGTLYPILMRLSDRGLLDSKWQSAPQSNLPPRHMYRLTIQGIKYAREQLEDNVRIEISGNALGSRA